MHADRLALKFRLTACSKRDVKAGFGHEIYNQHGENQNVGVSALILLIADTVTPLSVRLCGRWGLAATGFSPWHTCAIAGSGGSDRTMPNQMLAHAQFY